MLPWLLHSSSQPSWPSLETDMRSYLFLMSTTNLSMVVSPYCRHGLHISSSSPDEATRHKEETFRGLGTWPYESTSPA